MVGLTSFQSLYTRKWRVAQKIIVTSTMNAFPTHRRTFSNLFAAPPYLADFSSPFSSSSSPFSSFLPKTCYDTSNVCVFFSPRKSLLPSTHAQVSMSVGLVGHSLRCRHLKGKKWELTNKMDCDLCVTGRRTDTPFHKDGIKHLKNSQTVVYRDRQDGKRGVGVSRGIETRLEFGEA